MQEGQPFISIIIPNFNRGALLKETLESIRRQDYLAWEAIVVDDGSSDNSEAVTRTFSELDARIRFLSRNREPRGAPVCRNTGTENARGDYLIFLDSDDLLRPGALTGRANIISLFPDFDFWVFPMLMFREDPLATNLLWNIDNGQEDLRRFLVLDAPWQTTGPVWRKTAVQKIGGFTEGLACWQDIDFHLKALLAGLRGKKFYDLEPDTLYRQHETQSISQGEISSPAKLESRHDIFRRHTLALGERIIQYLPELRLLGGNIAIGAAKALNIRICREVIRFGAQHGIFPVSMTMQFWFILAFYQARLNRIPLLDAWMKKVTGKYRQDSNIGKHLLTKKPQDGDKPGT